MKTVTKTITVSGKTSTLCIPNAEYNKGLLIQIFVHLEECLIRVDLFL